MNNVKKKKLLIIDSEQNCKELCNILNGEYDISVVKNIREAIAAFGLQKEYADALLINPDAIGYLCNRSF